MILILILISWNSCVRDRWIHNLCNGLKLTRNQAMALMMNNIIMLHGNIAPLVSIIPLSYNAIAWVDNIIDNIVDNIVDESV